MGVAKPLAITVTLLALRGVGGVVGDGLARSAAQDEVARQLQSELGLPQRPEVELGGVPFTAVVVTRRLPSAAVSGVDVPLEISGAALSLDRVAVQATDLVLGNGQVVVTEVTGEAVLGYPALTTLVGVPVADAGQPGRLQVSYTAELFGGERVAAVTARPVLVDGAIELTEPQITIVGIELGQDVSRRIIEQLVSPIAFELPSGVVADSIAVDAAGLTLDLSARELVVPLG